MLFLDSMKFKGENWAVFYSMLLVTQLILSSIHTINFEQNTSTIKSELILKQKESNSITLEESQSVLFLIEEVKEEMLLDDFDYNLIHIKNFSSKNWDNHNDDFLSSIYSLIPYSPPEINS